MSNAVLSSGAAGRYASALFDLAKERDALDAVAENFTALREMIDESDDLRALIETPAYSRENQAAAMTAVAEKAGFDGLTRNFLGLLSRNGRLNTIKAAMDGYDALLDAHRGEISAEVISARPLSDGQRERLAATLKDKLGRDVNLNASVDESLLGGMVVRVGSKMIDASLKAKLATLQSAMIRA